MTLNPITIYKQIAALLKIKKEGVKLMDTIKTEVKPGWKTSEFWIKIIGMAAIIGSAASPLIPATAFPWIAGAAAFMTTAYSVARTIAKSTATPTDDALLDKLAEKLRPVIDLNKTKP
jgi:hypothetical protein